MAKKKSQTSTVSSQIEDTFEDLNVTLSDGLEVLEEIEESQEIEEIVEEVIIEAKPAPAPKKVVKEEPKAPGVYYNGELITKIPSRLGSKWTIIYQGKRHKVLKQDLEFIK